MRAAIATLWEVGAPRHSVRTDVAHFRAHEHRLTPAQQCPVESCATVRDV